MPLLLHLTMTSAIGIGGNVHLKCFVKVNAKKHHLGVLSMINLPKTKYFQSPFCQFSANSGFTTAGFNHRNIKNTAITSYYPLIIRFFVYLGVIFGHFLCVYVRYRTYFYKLTLTSRSE